MSLKNGWLCVNTTRQHTTGSSSNTPISRALEAWSGHRTIRFTRSSALSHANTNRVGIHASSNLSYVDLRVEKVTLKLQTQKKYRLFCFGIGTIQLQVHRSSQTVIPIFHFQYLNVYEFSSRRDPICRKRTCNYFLNDMTPHTTIFSYIGCWHKRRFL